jgi:phospholipase C
MGQLGKIEHIVVLMLENRSFDSMLGKLKPKSADYDGLTGDEQNPNANGPAVPAWNSPGTDETTMSTPDPDPGEEWTDINMQLFGTPSPTSPTPPASMSGFVENYLEQKAANPKGNYDPRSVMHYFTPDQVPVLSTLAKSFAVCDRWFASAPCQTWPNRWFVQAATADGYENNDPPHIPDVPTIFNRLEEAGQTWKIYFHDMAQAHTLLRLAAHLDHFHFYAQFQADCQSGTLPAYSFIEPQYYSDFGHPENDQHPPAVVTLGEQLIADVYNCIRGSKLWPKTLLIITYDEHGGIYDHVVPPPAQMPTPPRADQAFAFDRYGVRVPALIVSSYVEPGTVFGATTGQPYDHTSIIATVRKRFNLAALTKRDANAPDFDSVLTRPTPNSDGPYPLKALPYAPSVQTAARRQTQPLNSMQKALLTLAANFPAAGEDFHAHLTAVKAQGRLRRPPASASKNVHAARTCVKQQVGNLFQGSQGQQATSRPFVDFIHRQWAYIAKLFS